MKGDPARFDAAVITGIFDGYDTVKPICPQVMRIFGYDVEMKVDWVLVTDNPALLTEAEPGALAGWRVVENPQPGLHRNVAAKYPKFHPRAHTRALLTAWIDGSYRITSPRFLAEAGEYAEPLAQFAHPWRDCLFDEAAFSATLPKYAGQDLARQAAEYREAGMPEHWGLWATGVIIRNCNYYRDALSDFSAAWMAEVQRHTFQDQVSQPYVLRRYQLRPSALPGDHISNPWLKYEGSARH